MPPPAYRFEFTISEADFRKFCEKENCPVQKITEPRYVERYLEDFIRRDDYQDENSYRNAIGVVVTDGLFYYWQREDAYAAVHYVFDRHRGRAYLAIDNR